VPDRPAANTKEPPARRESLWAAYRDRRFWRIAPLSAVGIGTSWSLQGLWAAPWLRDVDGLDRAGIVQHLSAMAIAVCVGALLFGAVADRLRRAGCRTEFLLAATIGASIVAQAALVFAFPIPSLVLWSTIAAVGAATVLSFAIVAGYFPREVSGRANAALNLLHVAAAFLLQSGVGIIIAQWPETSGGYALEAHRAAMAAVICAQLVALSWFALSRYRLAALPVPCPYYPATSKQRTTGPTHGRRRPSQRNLEFQEVAGWRLAAAIGAALITGLSAALWQTVNTPTGGIAVASEAQLTTGIAAPGFLALRDRFNP